MIYIYVLYIFINKKSNEISYFKATQRTVYTSSKKSIEDRDSL